VRGSGIGTLIFGKVGYLAACLAAAIVLVVSGYAHGLVGDTTALESGANLGSNVPPTGAMNILLMGLESRTNFQGQTLSEAQLTQTHSGKVNGDLGSQDTDTLILVHVFAGGQKATGYSIPRDDVVNFPHSVTVNGAVLTEGKIDAAYLYAYDQYVSANIGTMGQTSALYTGANQAGQLFETQTVESVTGVHIDHFVVSNIEGFFQIAQQLGGINVCIASAPASIEPDGFKGGGNLVDEPFPGAPLIDSNSGFDAFRDGYNEKRSGDAAVQNITIPGYPSLQDANYIYVPNLQKTTVNGAFYGSAADKATKSVTVDVYNGSGAAGLAGDVSQAFAAAGYTTGKAGNASAQSQQMQGDTQVFYGAGAEDNADSIASMVGAQAATSLSSLPAGHVEVLLGQQVIALPPGLETFGATTVTEQDFVTAAQQNNLPASEMPRATGTGTTAGTQSVSATEVGVHAVAPVHPAAPAHPASTPSAANVKRPADVPAGIPCVY
jgi:hypothetical protein